MTTEEYQKVLRAAVDKLKPYYDIDKVKHNAVYVWTKESDDAMYTENVFDITKNEIFFYNKRHVIPDGAMPIIREIQAILREWFYADK